MSFAFIIFIAAFVLVLLLRIPIGPGMIMASVFYFVIAPDIASTAPKLVSQLFLSNMMTHYVQIAVPLFVFMAEIMNSGKVTDVIFKFTNACIGKKPGALGHVNVVASIIFSGMTGSAIADASGLGSMEIKAMNDSGYDKGFSCAITAASATIGPIFPPSIPMIFYAMLSGASIGALFIGGMVPGIIIGIALMVYIFFISRIRNYPMGDSVSFKKLVAVFIRAFPALLTVAILLGGIYTGIVTPTEAGALASLYAIVISVVIYRAIGFRSFLDILKRTVLTIGTLTIIVGASYVFTYIVAIEGIPQAVAKFFLGITENKYVLLLIINLAFILLGMIMDTMSIILIFIPIVLPMVNTLGIDLVHFGVVIVLNMMIGLSTPPFGLLLFVVSGISETPLGEVIKEIFPMLLVLFGVLFLVTYIEPIVLFLPNLLGF